MTDTRRNALIGFFVLGGLVAFGILIVKFGEASALLRTGYIVVAHFDRVTGMREGIEVGLAGVSAGRVKRVDLANRNNPGEGALVEMEIRSEFSVPSGSVATSVAQLMGQPVINIIPPATKTEPLPRDGSAIIRGEQVNPLSQVIDPRMMLTVERSTRQIGDLAEALTPAARDLHVLLEKRTTADVDAAPTTQEAAANLYTAVERLHNVLKHIETVVGDPAVQGNLRDTVMNLRGASEEARQAAAGFRTFSVQAQQTATKADAVVTRLDATVETTHRRIDELGKGLIANSDKISKMLDHMISASRDLAEGDGTLGMLLRDPKFYEELLLTVRRLNAAAIDLQTLIRQWQKQGLLGMR